VRAVNKLNGAELNGRDMLVREDREDRDVKAYNRDNGVLLIVFACRCAPDERIANHRKLWCGGMTLSLVHNNVVHGDHKCRFVIGGSFLHL
jgi:hypothetical protein